MRGEDLAKEEVRRRVEEVLGERVEKEVRKRVEEVLGERVIYPTNF